MKVKFTIPKPMNVQHHLIGSMRLIGGLGIFAFVAFAAIDPFVALDYGLHFLWVRLAAVLALLLIVALSWLPLTTRQMMILGALMCTITGLFVTVLTQMAGGPQSNYWTMLMLLFFGTVSLLPSSTLWAATIMVINMVFYVVWLSWWDSWNSQAEAAISCAGLLLSFVVCLWSSHFLNGIRIKTTEYQDKLQAVNRELQREVEERQKAEAQFLQAQKLEAIGQFVAGMAHEVNNVLTGVSIGAEAAKIHRNRQDAHDRQLRHIHQAVERGKNLTRDLLSFARKTPKAFEVLSLTAQVSQVVDMLERTHRGRVVIQTEIPEQEIRVLGDSAQLFQAMLNICLNGIDAMDGAGRLTIRLTAHDEDTCCLEISDQGCGMTATQINHIFEPFFTTKPVGQGTGLGLAMAYGVISEHGGHIEVDSILNVGTLFKLYLPMASQPIVSDEPPSENLFEYGGEGKILVIDDDDLVRELTTELLKEVGHTVMSADSGADALALYRLHQPFSVVIIDMIMPEQSGDLVFQQLRKINGAQPVLFISGYTNEQVFEQLQDWEGWRYLTKPFTAQQLFEAIGEIVQEATA